MVPSGTPMVAFTATATHAIRYDVLMKHEMCDSSVDRISTLKQKANEKQAFAKGNTK